MKLNIGCGYRKIPDYINIDNRIECNPDMFFDITKQWPFENNSIACVRAYDILEHIPIGKVIPLVEEIYRVLDIGGTWEGFTPSTDGRGAFQDPYHVSFHNINSHLYWTDDAHRNLYGIKAKFKPLVLKDVVSGSNIVHTFSLMKKI